ncbi:hypothetical protein [Calditerricola satsumensis]|uniref:hypothetical protein n=1 Tax=Calditerricola satsumensis TaxID=373054 RepID=UPI00210E7C3B|nr:hypothetical protein [Calditerricola satsumensis]
MTAPTLKDAYVVRFIRPIAPAELGYVLHLYQPIIGHAACALYLTLLFSVPQDSGVPQTGMFRWLVATTGLSLDALTQARRRLEAVGLLRTFHVSRDDGDAVFEFLLYPPFRRRAFWPTTCSTCSSLTPSARPSTGRLSTGTARTSATSTRRTASCPPMPRARS